MRARSVENDFVNKFAKSSGTARWAQRQNFECTHCGEPPPPRERMSGSVFSLSRTLCAERPHQGAVWPCSTATAAASRRVCGHGPSNNNKKAASDNLFSLCPSRPRRIFQPLRLGIFCSPSYGCGHLALNIRQTILSIRARTTKLQNWSTKHFVCF